MENTAAAGYEFDPASLSDNEKMMAAIAHLSGLFNSLGLNILVPLVLWLLENQKPAENRSAYVMFHAKQSLVFSLGMLAALSVLGVFATINGFLTMGLGLILFIPAILALALGLIVYQCYVGWKAFKGETMDYFLAADLVRKHWND